MERIEVTPGRIPRGTRVRVKTTNGGETIGVLDWEYVETYGVELKHLDREIPARRVASIEPLIIATLADEVGALRRGNGIQSVSAREVEGGFELTVDDEPITPFEGSLAELLEALDITESWRLDLSLHLAGVAV